MSQPTDLLGRLSFNQMTADLWPLDRAVRECAAHNVPHIGVWRHKLDTAAATHAPPLIRPAGRRVSSLCRGGWSSAPPPAERRERIADNRLAIEQAAALN